MVFVIDTLYRIFVIVIFARAIISFTNLDPYHPVRRTLENITEPILGPVRRLLPPTGGVDFSPFVVLILATILRSLLISIF
ncbi:MAG: YggT family protein [Ardenticatenaceae bacterium]|jgi:YggT family protein|nr:YggT family protein [Anaerolineales bacterium]MCB8916655.1 YggT family protein [Ardenticatenaceae bacterium]